MCQVIKKQSTSRGIDILDFPRKKLLYSNPPFVDEGEEGTCWFRTLGIFFLLFSYIYSFLERCFALPHGTLPLPTNPSSKYILILPKWHSVACCTQRTLCVSGLSPTQLDIKYGERLLICLTILDSRNEKDIRMLHVLPPPPQVDRFSYVFSGIRTMVK